MSEREDVRDAHIGQEKLMDRQISSRFIKVQAASFVVDVVQRLVEDGSAATGGDLKVQFFTDMGIVSGELVRYESDGAELVTEPDQDGRSQLNVDELFGESVERYAERALEDGLEIIPDGAHIVMKNATIQPYDPRLGAGGTINIHTPFVLFVDSIKGMTWSHGMSRHQ